MIKQTLMLTSAVSLLRLLFTDGRIGKVTRPLENALSMTTSSLMKMLKGDNDKLVLPSLA